MLLHLELELNTVEKIKYNKKGQWAKNTAIPFSNSKSLPLSANS